MLVAQLERTLHEQASDLVYWLVLSRDENPVCRPQPIWSRHLPTADDIADCVGGRRAAVQQVRQLRSFVRLTSARRAMLQVPPGTHVDLGRCLVRSEPVETGNGGALLIDRLEQALDRAGEVIRPDLGAQRARCAEDVPFEESRPYNCRPPIPATQELEASLIGLGMVSEQPRQHDEEIAIGEHAEVRNPGPHLEEAHSTTERILSRLIRRVAVFARELDRPSPFLVVELDPDLPRDVWPAAG